jgi:hypothetical protein
MPVRCTGREENQILNKKNVGVGPKIVLQRDMKSSSLSFDPYLPVPLAFHATTTK